MGQPALQLFQPQDPSLPTTDLHSMLGCYQGSRGRRVTWRGRGGGGAQPAAFFPARSFSGSSPPTGASSERPRLQFRGTPPQGPGGRLHGVDEPRPGDPRFIVPGPSLLARIFLALCFCVSIESYPSLKTHLFLLKVLGMFILYCHFFRITLLEPPSPQHPVPGWLRPKSIVGATSHV